jgi:cobalt-zinc-cadmium efflux system outer membrane protein
VHGIVLALFLQALTCPPVLAGPVPRSINEVVALALKHSAELAALEKETTVKQALAVQAGTLNNPTLELQGSSGSLSGSPEERTASIGINQELPLYGKLRLRREALQHESEALHKQHDNAVRLLKDEVSILVVDFSLAAQRQKLAADVVALNRDLVSIAGERFKAGDIPELDFNLAKVELIRAESRLLEVEREKIPLRIKISALTGLSENDLRPYERFPTTVPSSKPQEFVKQALDSRPDLLALARDRDKAETEKRLAAAEALPNLTAGFFAQWQRSSVEVGGMSSINSDTQLGLRLSMQIPVFDRNQGGKAAAQARLDAADSRRLALERAITTEVESAVSRLSSSERILTLLEQGIIPQLNENLKLTQEAYRLGEVGILSVIDEQKKFFEVNDAYLSAQHSRHVAWIKLETAVAADLCGGVQ